MEILLYNASKIKSKIPKIIPRIMAAKQKGYPQRLGDGIVAQ